MRYGIIVELEKELKAARGDFGKLEESGSQLIREEVTDDDIASIVSKWTGIPVSRMVEEEKSCPDVLLQLAAVRAALKKVSKIVFEDHVETCISNAINDGSGESAIVELKQALARYL